MLETNIVRRLYAEHHKSDLETELQLMQDGSGLSAGGSRSQPNLVAAIQREGWRICQVQFADDPGRHELGTGTLDFASAFNIF